MSLQEFIMPCSPKGAAADHHRGYFWSCVTLMMLTAITFPYHSCCKGQTKWERCVSKASSPSTVWSGLRHSGWWGLNISTGSLFQLVKHLTSLLPVSEDTAVAMMMVDEGERKAGHSVRFYPQSMQNNFFFFLSCLSVDIIPALPGWIN